MRSAAATIVGWLIVLVLAWIVVGSLLGTIRWLLRGVGVVVLVLVLLWAYFRLRSEP